jgi:bleomycin hydrolase
MSKGKETEIFNIPINNILELSKISIDKKQPIWFGCDFNKYINKDFSILDDNIYIYPDSIHKKTPSLSKEDQLRYGILIQNHAMLILGYNKQGNKIDKWYVENSHGDGKDILDDSNNQLVDKELLFNGNFSMSTSWFEKYVTQVVIHKNCFDKNILELYHKSRSVPLKPWSTCLGCSLMK